MFTFKFQITYLVCILLSLSFLRFLESVCYLFWGVRWDDSWFLYASMWGFFNALVLAASASVVFVNLRRPPVEFNKLFALTFPKTAVMIFALLIFTNVGLTYIFKSMAAWGVHDSKRIIVYIADTMGQFEFAENFYSRSFYCPERSYVSYSRHAQKDINGIKAIDPRFKRIIIKVYGENSKQRADLKLEQGGYYVFKQRDYRKATEVLSDSLLRFKQFENFPKCVSALEMLTWCSLQLRDKVAAKHWLDEALRISKLHQDKETLWYCRLLKRDAERLEDNDLTQAFTELNKKYLIITGNDKLKNDLPLSGYVGDSLLGLIMALASITIVGAIAKCLREKAFEWKTQVCSTTDLSQTLKLLNNLIIVEMAFRNWDSVQLYTEMSSRLNSKLP